MFEIQDVIKCERALGLRMVINQIRLGRAAVETRVYFTSLRPCLRWTTQREQRAHRAQQVTLRFNRLFDRESIEFYYEPYQIRHQYYVD